MAERFGKTFRDLKQLRKNCRTGDIILIRRIIYSDQLHRFFPIRVIDHIESCVLFKIPVADYLNEFRFTVETIDFVVVKVSVHLLNELLCDNFTRNCGIVKFESISDVGVIDFEPAIEPAAGFRKIQL